MRTGRSCEESAKILRTLSRGAGGVPTFTSSAAMDKGSTAAADRLRQQHNLRRLAGRSCAVPASCDPLRGSVMVVDEVTLIASDPLEHGIGSQCWAKGWWKGRASRCERSVSAVRLRTHLAPSRPRCRDIFYFLNPKGDSASSQAAARLIDAAVRTALLSPHSTPTSTPMSGARLLGGRISS